MSIAFFQFKSIPLLVRPNSVIAVGSREDRPDYDYADGVALQVYQLAEGEGAAAVVPSLAGGVNARFEVKREGHTIIVERQGISKPWQLLLVGIESIAPVEGGEAESLTQGALGTPTYETEYLKI